MGEPNGGGKLGLLLGIDLRLALPFTLLLLSLLAWPLPL